MPASATFTVEPFDAASASDEDLAALHDLVCAEQLEELPDDPLPPVEETVAEERNPWPYREALRWVVWSPDRRRIEGQSQVWLSRNRPENRHLADVWTFVRPAERRRGLGAHLTRTAIEAAIADDRTLIDLWTVHEGPSEAFVAALGGEKRMVERFSRLHLDELDATLLDHWIARAAERATDYELVAWTDGVPAEHRAAFAALSNVMNTAPREDLDMEDEERTPEMVEAWDERAAALGRSRRILVARHRPTGELAGFTDVVLNRHRPWHVQQGNTGVWPHHRDRGLGRWLKAAMLQWILAERPEARWVDTENAGSNRPMLAINDQLGFRPVSWWGGWQAPAAAAAERVSGMIRG